MVYEKSSEESESSHETLRIGEKTVEAGYDYRTLETDRLVEHYRSLCAVNRYSRSPAFIQRTVVSTLIFLLPFLALSMVPLGIDALTNAAPAVGTVEIAANGVFETLSSAVALSIAGFLLIWFALIIVHSARKHEVMNDLCDEISQAEAELRRRGVEPAER
jgi:predicted secreted protein